VGDVPGDLDVAADETVFFVGDCARFDGHLNGRKIKIEGNYTTTGQANPRKAKSNDMLLKILQVKAHALLQKVLGRPYIHMKGCPLSVAQLVSYYCTTFGIPDFNFDRRLVFGLNMAYLQMRANRFFNRIFG